MGEKISINKATTMSMRTTIPKSIITHFDLKEKDQLEWEIKAKKNNLAIIVKPIKEMI